MPYDGEYVFMSQSVHGKLDVLVWYFPGVHRTHMCICAALA